MEAIRPVRLTMSPSFTWSVGPSRTAPHVVLFQVHHDRFHPVVELQEFVSLGIVETVNPGYAIAHLEHRTYFFRPDTSTDPFQLLAQDGGNFTHFYLICHTSFCFYLFSSNRLRISRSCVA